MDNARLDAAPENDTGPLIEYWVGRVMAVHLERYEAPIMVFRQLWGKIPGGEIGPDDRFGGEEGTEYTEPEILEGIQKVGLWGFCHTRPLNSSESPPVPVIHYWRNDDPAAGPVADQTTRLSFFAHELSHAAIEQFLEIFGKQFDPEVLADITAAIALRAVALSSGENEPKPGE